MNLKPANVFDSDRDDQDDLDEEKMIRTELMNISTKQPGEEKRKSSKIDHVTVNFWEKIFLLWSAPVTKFWINLVRI